MPPAPAPPLKLVDLRGAGDDVLARLPAPEVSDDAEVLAAVAAILDQVRSRGDDAVRDFTERFDGVRPDDLRVQPDQLKAALAEIPSDLRAALEIAHDNISAYHA